VNQLRQEKCELEETLEKEQEYQVNKLMRRIEKLQAEVVSKQATLEQVSLIHQAGLFHIFLCVSEASLVNFQSVVFFQFLQKKYLIPSSSLPKLIPEVTAKRMTGVRC